MCFRVICSVLKEKKAFLRVLLIIIALSLVLLVVEISSLSDSFDKQISTVTDYKVTVSSNVNITDRIGQIYNNNDDKYFDDYKAFIEFCNVFDQNDFKSRSIIKDDFTFSSYIVENNCLIGMYRTVLEGDKTRDSDFYNTNEENYRECNSHSDNAFDYMSNTYIENIDSAGFLDFIEGKIVLSKGRCVSDYEIEKGLPVCMIPENLVILIKEGDLVSRKAIEIGDEIVVSNRIDGVCSERLELNNSDVVYFSNKYTVIGKYRNIDNRGYKIYIPNQVFDKNVEHILEIVLNNNTFRLLNNNKAVLSVKPVVFYVDNYFHLKHLIEKIRIKIPDDYSYNSNTYDMVSTMSVLLSLSSCFSIVSPVLFILVVMLTLVCLFLEIQYSRFQTALLLKYGISEKKIIIQYILEYCLVVIIACLCIALILRLMPVSSVESFIRSPIHLSVIQSLSLNIGNCLICFVGLMIIDCCFIAAVVSWQMKSNSVVDLIRN